MYRNKAGYSDPTAGEALGKIMKEYRQQQKKLRQLQIQLTKQKKLKQNQKHKKLQNLFLNQNKHRKQPKKKIL